MKILYAYVKSFKKLGEKDSEVHNSNDFFYVENQEIVIDNRVSYDVESNKITIEEIDSKEKRVKYHEIVSELKCIVGENGVGKTTLLDLICFDRMNLTNNIANFESIGYQFDGFIIYEKIIEDGSKEIYYTTYGDQEFVRIEGNNSRIIFIESSGVLPLHTTIYYYSVNNKVDSNGQLVNYRKLKMDSVRELKILQEIIDESKDDDKLFRIIPTLTNDECGFFLEFIVDEGKYFGIGSKVGELFSKSPKNKIETGFIDYEGNSKCTNIMFDIKKSLDDKREVGSDVGIIQQLKMSYIIEAILAIIDAEALSVMNVQAYEATGSSKKSDLEELISIKLEDIKSNIKDRDLNEILSDIKYQKDDVWRRIDQNTSSEISKCSEAYFKIFEDLENNLNEITFINNSTSNGKIRTNIGFNLRKFKFSDNLYRALLVIEAHNSNNIYTENNMEIVFPRMSDGEFVLFSIFTKILSDTQGISSCEYTLVIDEPDQRFHPELSRQFLSNLVDALYEFSGCSNSYNIILTTHSPFMLSDIMPEDIIVLKKNGNELKVQSDNKSLKSYGANIYDIITEEFFLYNTIGELATNRINNCIKILEKLDKDHKESSVVCDHVISDLAEVKYITEQIGDEFLNKYLTDKYEDVAIKYKVNVEENNLKKIYEKLDNLDDNDLEIVSSFIEREVLKNDKYK